MDRFILFGLNVLIGISSHLLQIYTSLISSYLSNAEHLYLPHPGMTHTKLDLRYMNP
jgi:hypothetical protein